MKRLIVPIRAFLPTVLVFFTAGMASAADWHHPLHLAGDGCWRGRVRVVVHNETGRPLVGRSVGVKVGSGPGVANLVDTPAEAIRLCNERGVEMLFGLTGPDGSPLTTGPVPVSLCGPPPEKESRCCR